MRNYIVINGKKSELTEEQLRQLGIEIKKANPYKKAKLSGKYYNVSAEMELFEQFEGDFDYDRLMYNTSNYCTDKDLAEQDMLHDLLNRKLRQFSNLNGGIGLNSNTIEKLWEDNTVNKFYIVYNYFFGQLEIYSTTGYKQQGTSYFYTKKIAERAIEEIIKPFMEEHPGFVW